MTYTVEPPRFTSTTEYANSLKDVSLWAPYAAAALDSHGIRVGDFEPTFAGTYPVLLNGPVVVKLFGYSGDWRRSWSSEATATEATADICAPRIVASGALFPGRRAEPWPYLVMDRSHGIAWRDAGLAHPEQQRVARQLGQRLSEVHRVSIDSAEVHPDWIDSSGHSAAQRHRLWGSLPDQLVDEVDSFLHDYLPGRTCLVHADVTEDHVFVASDRLAHLIDWGDAMLTDPFYELPALHLGTFGGQVRLLRAFLDGYGWEADKRFTRRAMQATLMHQFDVLADVPAQIAHAQSLEDLATLLWSV